MIFMSWTPDNMMLWRRISLFLLVGFFLTGSACESQVGAVDGSGDADGDENSEPVGDSNFVMGADLSYVNQILDHGGVYKSRGEIQNPYQIFADRGATTARFRLFKNPEWTREVYGENGDQMYNDIADVTLGIQRAREQGMSVLLNFHYSNTWADPGEQKVPEEWSEIGFEAVKDSIYSFTYSTLMHLNSQDALPEMIQVGNETNCGLVHPYADICADANWKDLGELFNSGISAVRDVEDETNADIRVVLHVAQPENVEYWFDGVINEGEVTDFDVVGFSYYTAWSDVPLNQISSYVRTFRSEFERDVMILETAYPWTLDGADDYGNILGTNSLVDGYPATPEGQRRFMTDLVSEVKEGGGHGVFYWEPAWITSDMKDLWGTGSSWENSALFDFEGNAHEGFQYMSED